VLPAMREHGRGTILATGSWVALDPRPEETARAVGKAAARALLAALAKEVESDGVHVALVTVMGPVAAGTAFNPASIAEAFWTLHTEPSGAWRAEVLFGGRP
jgi:short-subunit dehydrogenase